MPRTNLGQTIKDYVQDVNQARNEVMVAKENILDQKKNELVADLDTQIDNMRKELLTQENMNNAKIMLAISNKNLKYGLQKRYTADEMIIIFQKYKELVAMLTDIDNFIPSKENFSAFAGFSTSTYNKYKLSNDPALVEVMELIDDYIKDTNLALSQNRKADNYTTIFRMKASMGMVETQPVQIVEHRKVANKDRIKEQLDNLRGNKTIIEAQYEEE